VGPDLTVKGAIRVAVIINQKVYIVVTTRYKGVSDGGGLRVYQVVEKGIRELLNFDATTDTTTPYIDVVEDGITLGGTEPLSGGVVSGESTSSDAESASGGESDNNSDNVEYNDNGGLLEISVPDGEILHEESVITNTDEYPEYSAVEGNNETEISTGSKVNKLSEQNFKKVVHKKQQNREKKKVRFEQNLDEITNNKVIVAEQKRTIADSRKAAKVKQAAVDERQRLLEKGQDRLNLAEGRRLRAERRVELKENQKGASAFFVSWVNVDNKSNYYSFRDNCFYSLEATDLESNEIQIQEDRATFKSSDHVAFKAVRAGVPKTFVDALRDPTWGDASRKEWDLIQEIDCSSGSRTSKGTYFGRCRYGAIISCV
jgi:hypothetical protein